MGYPMIFETKIVKLSDGRLIHFDRSGCNNDNEGRKPNDWTAKVYTEQEFQNRIESFKTGSKPYKECSPHEWEIKIYGRMATGYDYGAHLERMRKRGIGYADFIAENEVRVNKCSGVWLFEPESKSMTYDEFEKYRKDLPITSKLEYRILYKPIDMDNENEFVKAVDSGAPLSIFISDRSPIQSAVVDEQEDTEMNEDTGMNMSM